MKINTSKTSFNLRILGLLFCVIFAMPLWAVRTADLRCEMLKNPWGIDNTTPGLSWKVRPDHKGIRQTAYQIIAASNPKLLSEEKADLWNTGRVNSEQQLWIRYAGKPLESRSLVYWKVKVWDEQGEASAWSGQAHFSVGLLKSEDWTGKYITMERSDTTVSPLLRKEFFCPNQKEPLFLHINTLGYHEVYVNGQPVNGDVLAPAMVQWPKRSLAMTYDLTSLVHSGRNELVIWLGKGWYDASLGGCQAGGPFVMAQLERLTNTGWQTVIQTDKTWKAHESGRYCPDSFARNKFNGEVVDGSKVFADLTAASLDRGIWTSAKEVKIPRKPITPMMCEPNRIQQEITPVRIWRFDEDCFMVDMGKSLVGWTKFNFRNLHKGQTITMSYCDMLNEIGDFDAFSFSDQYIAAGEGEETFCNKFNYHAYRYIKISGLNYVPDLKDVLGMLIHTGYTTRSSFVCSDPDINAIHDMIHYTFPCLTLGGYMVDCPHLERQGYGGDGNASIISAQTMYSLYPLYNNWLQAYADAQGDDGSVPHTGPVFHSCGGGPFWCVFIANAPWQTYLQYGDKQLLEKYYGNMQAFQKYAEKYMTDGLMLTKNRWPNVAGYRSWFLGDWALPNEEHQYFVESNDDVNSCSMSWFYDIMSKVSKVLGKDADSKRYVELRDATNQQIHKTFYNASDATYAKKLQLDLAFPLFVGATPDGLKDKVHQSIKNITQKEYDGHFFTGLVGIPILTQWLTKTQESEFFYSMLKQRGFPGYLYMIENGATTTWEHWNARRSRIHNCFNGIGSWFYQALGGIVPDETSPAYKHFFLRPQPVKDISFVRLSKPTPYGNINLEWRKDAQKFEIIVDIPSGTTATLELPFAVARAENVGTDPLRQGIIYNEQDTREVLDIARTPIDLKQPIVLESGAHRMTFYYK